MLREQVEAWIYRDPDDATRKELQDLLDTNQHAELEDRFRGRLSFGTAGLRGVMGAGPNRMNRLVIRESACGLARYLLQVNPASIELGVVVSFDGRLQSRVFAEETASVLAAFGFKVHLSKGPLPTPVCAYALKAFGPQRQPWSQQVIIPPSTMVSKYIGAMAPRSSPSRQRYLRRDR